MVNGLVNQGKRDDFVLNLNEEGTVVMTDWGEYKCKGGLEVVTIQEIAGKMLGVDSIVYFSKSNGYETNEFLNAMERANCLNLYLTELIKFQRAIRDIKLGNVQKLFEFCILGRKYRKEYDLSNNPGWEMTNRNLEYVIPQINDLISRLKEEGF